MYTDAGVTLHLAEVSSLADHYDDQLCADASSARRISRAVAGQDCISIKLRESCAATGKVNGNSSVVLRTEIVPPGVCWTLPVKYFEDLFDNPEPQAHESFRTSCTSTSTVRLDYFSDSKQCTGRAVHRLQNDLSGERCIPLDFADDFVTLDCSGIWYHTYDQYICLLLGVMMFFFPL